MTPAKPGPFVDRAPAFLAAVACFAAYLVWAFPYPDWLDSPELAASAATLGIFHSPGSPLAVLAAHVLAFWPFASGHYRLIVMSPLFAAVAVYVLARLAQTTLREALGRRAGAAGAGVAAVAFGLAPGVVLQATRLEVYTLAIALGLIILRDAVETMHAGDADGGGSRLCRAAFALGAAAAVHPLIGLACAAAWVVPFVTKRHALFGGRPARTLAAAAGAVMAGAVWLPALPLFVRTARDLRWGELGSPGDWLDFIMGKAFAHSFSAGAAAEGSLVHTILILVNGTGGGIVLACGLTGLVVLLKRRPDLAVAYGLVLGLDLATLASQKIVLLTNPDAVAYLLPAFAVVILLALEAVAAAARNARAATALVAAFVAAALVQVGPGILAYDRSGCAAGVVEARAALAALPPGASVVLDDFNLVFMLEYLTLAEGERPDVHVSYARDPGGGAAAGLRVFDASPVRLDEWKRTGARLTRFGMLWSADAAAAAAPTASSTDAALFAWQPLCRTGDPVDARAASAVQWRAFMSSQLALAMGDRAAASGLARLAHCAVPEDEIAGRHAAALDVAPGACTGGEAARIGGAFAGRAPPLTPRTAFLAGGLALWTAGLTRRWRWRFVAAGLGAVVSLAAIAMG